VGCLQSESATARQGIRSSVLLFGEHWLHMPDGSSKSTAMGWRLLVKLREVVCGGV
jgi:hypothetical protein